MVKKKTRSAKSFTKKIEDSIVKEIKRLLATRRPVKKAAKQVARKATKSGKPRKKTTKKLVAKAARKVVKRRAGQSRKQIKIR